MNPWICALLIATAGGCGGFVNALMTERGIVFPTWRRAIWCPGFIGNVVVGAFSAFASWAFYGAGSSIEVTGLTAPTELSLRFSALAGAFLVGVAGAKWISSETDKRFYRRSIITASESTLSPEAYKQVMEAPAREVLDLVESRNSHRAA